MTLTERIANTLSKGLIYRLRCDLSAEKHKYAQLKRNYELMAAKAVKLEQGLISSGKQVNKLLVVNEKLGVGLGQIVAQVTPKANGTVRRIERIARKALAEGIQSDA